MGNTATVTVAVLVAVVVVAVGLAVAVSSSRRAEVRSRPGAGRRRRDPTRPGGVLMGRKADKHFRLVGHTLVVRADPAVVADVVAPAVLAARARFRVTDTLESGEVAAWEAESIFGAFPRLVVRASPLVPGATEVGATRMRVSIRFPQGGPFVERGVTAARKALQERGFVVDEYTREFVPGPQAAWGQDGTWYVGGVVPAADTFPT